MLTPVADRQIRNLTNTQRTPSIVQTRRGREGVGLIRKVSRKKVQGKEKKRRKKEGVFIHIFVVNRMLFI